MKTNYRFGEAVELARQVEPKDERVEFRQVFETGNGGVDILAFKKGQRLDTHLAPAEVMVNVLEGEILFTMNGKPVTLRQGEFLLMGEGVPHSVEAKSDAKVLLVKVKP